MKLKSYHIYNCADNQGKCAILILLHHIISIQKSGTHYRGIFEPRIFTRNVGSVLADIINQDSKEIKQYTNSAFMKIMI